MTRLKIALISLAVLGVICLVGYVVYNVAYDMGETKGYDLGFSAGEKVGYSSGKQDGYSSGKTDGYSLGKQEGYDTGYSSGRTEGYTEGMQAGLGHGYTLKDPTYEEMVTFLREDETDRNKYEENTYVCSHFARDVCNNAEKKGLRCAFIALRYPNQGHTIIAFNTIDKGLIYFEPQTDERANPVVGKQYYQCIEPRPGTYYTPPSYDDTIKDILMVAFTS